MVLLEEQIRMMAEVTEGSWPAVFVSVVQAGLGRADLGLLFRDQRLCQSKLVWDNLRPCCRQTSTGAPQCESSGC